MKWNNWYLLHSNVKPWTFRIKLEPYICTVWSVNEVPARDLPETHQDWIPAKYSNPKVFPSGQYIAMQCCKTGNLHLPETLWWVTGCLVQHQEIACYVNTLNLLTQIIFAFLQGTTLRVALVTIIAPQSAHVRAPWSDAAMPNWKRFPMESLGRHQNCT